MQLCISNANLQEKFLSISKDPDIHGDGKIGLSEVLYVLQRVAQLRAKMMVDTNIGAPTSARLTATFMKFPVLYQISQRRSRQNA